MIVNWPELSGEQIENKAAEFRQQALAALDSKAVSAVPVEQIAEHYLGYELEFVEDNNSCLLYTSPSPRDGLLSRMPSSA